MKSKKTFHSYGWKVISREHAWRNAESGADGFIDIVLGNDVEDNQRFVIECKRPRDASWIFLIPVLALGSFSLAIEKKPETRLRLKFHLIREGFLLWLVVLLQRSPNVLDAAFLQIFGEVCFFDAKGDTEAIRGDLPTFDKLSHGSTKIASFSWGRQILFEQLNTGENICVQR